MKIARIRTIKPELPRHRGLYELEQKHKIPFRFLWACLPMIVDREGRFQWRPWDLKLDLLPYDEVDLDHALNVLWVEKYIEKYVVAGETFGFLPTFLKHQRPNHRESPSVLPEPTPDAVLTPSPRGDDNGPGMPMGKGREGKSLARVSAPRAKGAIPEFSSYGSFLDNVSYDVQGRWISIYKNVEWINDEITKAEAWLHAKGVTKKNLGLFITNWLSNAKKPDDLSKLKGTGHFTGGFDV